MPVYGVDAGGVFMKGFSYIFLQKIEIHFDTVL